MAERVLSLLYRLLAGVLALACAGLFVFGLFATVVFRQYQENDYPDFYPLRPLPTLLAFAACACALFLLLKKAGVLARTRAPRLTRGGVLLPDRWFFAALLFAVALCSFLLYVVRGLPTSDAKFCIGIAQAFLAGDYSAIKSGYLTVYPFQLSYCMLSEWVMRLFGANSYLPHQLLNVASIALSLFFLYEISWELSEDVRVCDAASLLSFGCLMLYAYSTFIYNDIWSLAPLFGGIWLFLRFLKGERLLTGILAALLAAISFFIKSNGTIALIAMGVVAAICFFKALAARTGRAWRHAAVLVLLVAFSGAMRYGVNAHYEALSGAKLADGVPAAAYLAMGMEESDDGKYGWYTGANVRFLSGAKNDSAQAAADARAWIRERIAYFADHPKYFVKFYGIKYLTQWGDPTKVSLREQELTGRHQEGQRPALAESVTFGTGFYIMQGVMHLFHLLLMFFAAAEIAAICFGKRRVREMTVLPLLFIFGGMLFHQLWEASGRYALRYELALLPFAAAGMVRLFCLPARPKKRKGR